MSKKHIVFDIVGTIISYETFFAALSERIGPQLLSHNIPPRLFAWTWMEAADLESHHSHTSGRPKLFKNIFAPLLYRYLAMAGIPHPHTFISSDDVEYIVSAYSSRLTARPGILECFRRLREAGFTIWALTSGDAERVREYLARNEIPIAEENFIACEDIGKTKPAPEVYCYVRERLEDAEEMWFAACHMWDAAAAKHNGYVFFSSFFFLFFHLVLFAPEPPSCLIMTTCKINSSKALC